MAALEPFACGAPPQGPAPLPYLAETHRTAFDVSLQALLRPHGTVDGQVVTSTNMKHLYVAVDGGCTPCVFVYIISWPIAPFSRFALFSRLHRCMCAKHTAVQLNAHCSATDRTLQRN